MVKSNGSNVEGSGISSFGTFEKATGTSDTITIAAPDGFNAEPFFLSAQKKTCTSILSPGFLGTCELILILMLSFVRFMLELHACVIVSFASS